MNRKGDSHNTFLKTVDLNTYILPLKCHWLTNLVQIILFLV